MPGGSAASVGAAAGAGEGAPLAARFRISLIIGSDQICVLTAKLPAKTADGRKARQQLAKASGNIVTFLYRLLYNSGLQALLQTEVEFLTFIFAIFKRSGNRRL